MKFKAGDRVRCIEESSVNHIGVINRIYTVRSDGVCGGLILKENEVFKINKGNTHGRFELVVPQYTWTSKFNIGDEVTTNSNGAVKTICEIRFNDGHTMYIFKSVYCANESELNLHIKPQPRKMTVKEICEALGKEIEIIK